MTKTTHLFLALLIALSLAADAQKKSAGSLSATYKLLSVKVAGTQRYTEKEILPASGVSLGQNIAEPDLREAVRRLGDTGLFTDVAYTFSYSNAGTKVEFQLTDIDQQQLVPVEFENSVWLTAVELANQSQN